MLLFSVFLKVFFSLIHLIHNIFRLKRPCPFYAVIKLARAQWHSVPLPLTVIKKRPFNEFPVRYAKSLKCRAVLSLAGAFRYTEFVDSLGKAKTKTRIKTSKCILYINTLKYYVHFNEYKWLLFREYWTCIYVRGTDSSFPFFFLCMSRLWALFLISSGLSGYLCAKRLMFKNMILTIKQRV